MESVCVLKTMSTFVHNTTEIPSKHGKPFSSVFSLPDSIRKEQSLKRSMECGNDIDEQVSPVKQKRSDEPGDQTVLDHFHAISSKEQFFTPRNMVSAESSVKSCNEICPELPSDNNCQTGSVTDHVCDRQTCSRSPVTGRQEVTSSSAQKLDSYVTVESTAALQKNESPNSPVANRDSMALTQGTSDLRDGDVTKTQQEETLSMSDPCNAMSESERDRISPNHTQQSFTLSSRLDHAQDEKRDLTSFVQQNMTQGADDNNDNHDSDNNDNNSDDNCDSLPPTPSSGFIDIEADTPPSSPLNLTTNSNIDNQTRCHTDENQNEDSQRREASPKPPHTFLSERLLGQSSITQKVSHETKKDFQNSEKSPTEKPQEKKTNFSIDAILRPDFGALNNSSQSQVSFQQPKTHNQNSHFKNSFKSSHSAFTAVDLSTRSRSDSLSSPSSSNSSSSLSPSPPLSNSSLSPGHKHSLTPGMVYEKYHPGQENFLFASRLFPDPTKDFESFIGGNFPLLGSVHGNSIAKFPFLYGPQPTQQYKLSHMNTHPQDSDISKTKPDHLQTNISKLLTCSLYPFLNNPQSRNFPESPKLSRDTGDNLKLRNDPALQALRHNHNSKLGHDLSALTRSSEKSQPQNVVSPTRKASSGQGNASTTMKTNADTGKPVVKNEDSGSTEGKTQERGGKGKDENPLWPAWVFCTRYSDRPSSGPRSRKPKRNKSQDEKRPRTAFTNDQLQRLKREFEDCRYLTETRRKNLADELGLTESQIKIWFQNKRAKIKKSVGVKNPLALQLMEQGLYNHSTVKLGDESS